MTKKTAPRAAARGALYSIGYGNPAKKDPVALPDPAALARTVYGLGVTLVDVRADAGPASADETSTDGAGKVRWANGRLIYVRRGFWRADLSALLGDRYQYRGHTLGGIRKGSDGPTPEGLRELHADVAGGARLMLMCSEDDPGACHRHHLIALPMLDEHGIDALHVHGGDVILASELRAHMQRLKRGRDIGYLAFDLADLVRQAAVTGPLPAPVAPPAKAPPKRAARKPKAATP